MQLFLLDFPISSFGWRVFVTLALNNSYMSRSKPPSIYRSILGLKCPRCRKGNLFIKKGLVVYKKMLDMEPKCPHCNLNYEIEPGFWLGALWTSYPIVVLIELPFLITALLVDGIGMWLSFLGLVLAFFITWPLMLRLGRSLWIHLNIRYDKAFDGQQQ